MKLTRCEYYILRMYVAGLTIRVEMLSWRTLSRKFRFFHHES